MSVEERLDILDGDVKSHAKTISSYIETFAMHDRRLTAQNEALVGHGLRIAAIEEARRIRQLEEVRREEREIAREARVNDSLEIIHKRLDGIDGAVARVTWIIVTAVLGGAIALAVAKVFA